MRRMGLGIGMFVLAACDASSGFDATDALVSRAVAGEEESLAGGALAREDGEERPFGDPCDAPERFAAMFADADTNADGALDAAEGRDAGRRHGPPPHVFHLVRWVYDADDDQSLSEAELDLLLDDHVARCEVMKQKLLDASDADGDGELSEAEKEAAREARPEGPPPGHGPRGERPAAGDAPPPVVDEFDADGDGDLSATEAATARSAIRARIRAGERPVAPPAE